MHLTIPDEHLVPLSKDRQGVYSFVSYSEKLEDILYWAYGRHGLCLKVFKGTGDAPLNEFRWGQHLLIDCTRIQNLFAWHDLAPKVYDIAYVNDRCYAQVTQFADLLPQISVDKKIAPELKTRYMLDTRWDMNPKNWLNGRMLDFQAWRFGDKDLYKQRLIDEAYKNGAWGSRSEPYSPPGRFPVPSQRDVDHRIDLMKLNEMDHLFQTRSVLDIGCNLGGICTSVAELGAKRVTGIDLPHVVETAMEISNWLGYWQIDYRGMRLPSSEAIGQHDIVFALSVDRQIGYGKWMADLCSTLFYLEGHVADHDYTFMERLERDFSKVEYLGATKDHGPRPVFRCWK